MVPRPSTNQLIRAFSGALAFPATCFLASFCNASRARQSATPAESLQTRCTLRPKSVARSAWIHPGCRKLRSSFPGKVCECSRSYRKKVAQWGVQRRHGRSRVVAARPHASNRENALLLEIKRNENVFFGRPRVAELPFCGRLYESAAEASAISTSLNCSEKRRHVRNAGTYRSAA